MPDYHIRIEPRLLHFKEPAGTSRGVYLTRRISLLHLTDDERPGVEGLGECAPLPRLSVDDAADYDDILRGECDHFCRTREIDTERLRRYPSILFGLETAVRQLERGGGTALSSTPFARGEEGIIINGLVWMGSFEAMARQIDDKLQRGFHCIKLKIGAIGFDEEIELVRRIRESYSSDVVELRVDANGAFTPEEAPQRLAVLARYGLHSIEQPIRAGQWDAMAALCRTTMLPIALDEELIGVNEPEEKERLLDAIAPQYIILKPSLHGGISGCREWIAMAARRGIGSWITSALESNVGLNAIAHFAAETYGAGCATPQGLGTGQLFTDNIDMPLEIRGERLYYMGR